MLTPEMKQYLYGLILSGGQSSRMGQDKGLIQINKVKFIEQVLRQMKKYIPHIFVSLNPGQIREYENILTEEQIISDSVNTKGPMTGLLSFHEQFPQQDVFVMAVDLIRMNDQLFEKVLESYAKNKQQKFILFRHENGYVESLFGIYSRKALQKIYSHYQQDSLKGYSLLPYLKPESQSFLPLSLQEEDSFFNCNEPEDLKKITRKNFV